jgi:hypothetical protein
MPGTRLSSELLTLSLYSTNSSPVMLYLGASTSPVVAVCGAVTFSVHFGVYCFVHSISPRVRVPLPAVSEGIPPHQLAVPEIASVRHALEELTLYPRVQGLDHSHVQFGLLPDRGTRGVIFPGCEGAASREQMQLANRKCRWNTPLGHT